MADILIKNMEMPKEGSITITIRHDGAINFIGDMGSNLGRLVDCKATALSEYGRLIDADAEIAKIKAFMKVLNKETESGRRQYHECDCVLHYLTDAPAIVEATE